jgi:hypothetical protein
MISSYVGENAEFERQFLSGELEVELTPQVRKSLCGCFTVLVYRKLPFFFLKFLLLFKTERWYLVQPRNFVSRSLLLAPGGLMFSRSVED